MYNALHRRSLPPQSLNLENAKIWEGWNLLGDKEVVREASAKGFYVNLAINFIAARKNIDVLEAQKWFKEQVRQFYVCGECFTFIPTYLNHNIT